MATPGGTQDPGLSESPIAQTLQDDPCSFEFFQAVTLLHWLRKGLPVGRFSNPEDEAVHFRANNRLVFPASQIQDFEYRDHAPAQMTVNFMGLTGHMGVLPYCYTELILERLREKDTSFASFLNIFNHRIGLSFLSGLGKVSLSGHVLPGGRRSIHPPSFRSHRTRHSRTSPSSGRT